MKIHGGIIASVVAMLFASTAFAQSPNNAVWGINDQNEVFRYNPSQNTFERMPGILKASTSNASVVVSRSTTGS